MKNNTIWNFLDEDSYTSEEIEWIQKYIANEGDSYNGTFYYDYLSDSSTPQKVFMPSDQRAKILAMHRDAKANAGIYVGIILSFYFIFIFILFRRSGIKLNWRQREVQNNATVEQGRYRFCGATQDDREGKCLARFLCCLKKEESGEEYELNELALPGRSVESEQEAQEEGEHELNNKAEVEIFTVENEFKKLEKRRKIKSSLDTINEDSQEDKESIGEDDEEEED